MEIVLSPKDRDLTSKNEVADFISLFGRQAKSCGMLLLDPHCLFKLIAKGSQSRSRSSPMF